MATETLFPNGDDNGWPTGDWTDIDEGIASADGATYETNVDDDVTLIDLDDSARSDSDTINSVTVKIRAKDTGAGGKNSLIVDLFIGGTGLGATPAQVLNNSYATYTFTSVLWDLDHTAAELDGMQVEITANQTGMGTAADWQIDAIDVDIDYTAGVSNNTEEPGVKNLLLDEKTPSVIEGYNRFPDKDTLQLDGKIPAVTYDWVIPVAQDTLQITEQTPTRLLAEFITPDVGSLTLTAKVPNRARRVFITGYAPTVGIDVVRSPDQDTLLLTGEIPVVGQSITIVVPTGTLTLTGEIPTVVFDWVVFPAQDELIITGQAPDRIINHIRGPPQETLALNGQVPTIGIDVVKTPAPDTLALNGLTPTTTTNHIQAPATETLVLTGQIPTLAFDWVITPGIETLNLTGSIPAVTSSQAEVPDPGSLTLTGQTPTLVYDWVITPDQGTLALTGEIPTLDNSIPPAAESLILTGEIPTVDSGGGDVTRDPATGTLALTGEIPALVYDWVTAPNTGTLTLTGQTPTLVYDWVISPDTGGLTLTGQTPQRPSKYNLVGYTPTIDIEEIAVPGTGSLTLAGKIPTPVGASTGIIIVHPQTYVDDDYVNQDYIVDAATSLTLSGSAPTIDSIGASPSVPVPTGSLSISSVRPVIAEDKTADPGTGSLSLTGAQPRRPWEVRLIGYAPELSFGSGTATPDADTLALTGYEPFAVVDSAGGTSRSPATKAVTITGYSPALEIFIANPDASLQLTGYIPSKAFGSFTVKTPAQGSLSLTGQTPQAVSTLKPLPGKGSVNLTGYAPSAGVNVIGVDTGSVTLNGSVPTLVYDWTIVPGTKSLNLTGLAPSKSFDFFINKSPAQKALALTGQQPNVSSRTTPAGSLSLTGLAPTLDSGVFPGAGSLALTGYQTPVNIGNDITIQVPTRGRGLYIEQALPLVSGGNLLAGESDFTDAAWTAVNGLTVNANVANGPDGTLTADELDDSNAAASSLVRQTLTGQDGTLQYNYGVYIRKDAVGRATRFASLRLVFDGSTREDNEIFVDTNTGEVSQGDNDSGVTAFGVNDYSSEYWYAFITATSADSANDEIDFEAFPARGSGAGWTLDNTETGAATFWGAQVYAGDPAVDGDPNANRDYVQADYIDDGQQSVTLTGLRPGAVVESFDWIATPDTVTLGLTGYNLFIDNSGRNKKAFIVRPENRTKVVKPRKYITVIKPEHRK